MAELWLPGAFQPGLGLHRGMAGEGGGPACPAGCADPARFRRRGPARVAGSLLRRWASLALLLAFYLGASEAQVLSSRIWPARDYTRLTLESREAIQYTIFSIKDPERLVLDLETNDLPAALAELHTKVAADDPYIQGLRVARNRPGIVRLVLDLKAEV